MVEEHPLPLVEVEDVMRRSDRSTTRNRLDYKKLAGYVAVRVEIDSRWNCYTTLKVNQVLSKYKVPKTYREARYSENWSEWKLAFEKQMCDLEQRHVWDLV